MRVCVFVCVSVSEWPFRGMCDCVYSYVLIRIRIHMRILREYGYGFPYLPRSINDKRENVCDCVMIGKSASL